MKSILLSLVVPTFNERENLPEIVNRVRALDLNAEFIIVDDNSPDGTGLLADELASRIPNIRVIHRPAKRGLASAVMDGFGASSGRFIGVMDGDLQHPPEALGDMVSCALRGFDLVVGSRYVKGGGVLGWSLSRQIVSKAATLLAHLLIPRSRCVHDPMSGFFLFYRGVIEGVVLNPSGYKILLEVLAKGRHSRVTEAPYVFVPRRRGASKLRSGEIFAYLKLLWSLVFRP